VLSELREKRNAGEAADQGEYCSTVGTVGTAPDYQELEMTRR